MALQTTRCLACLSAVLFSVMIKPSQTQRCSSEKMEDIMVYIPAAFSKGIRGTDPIYTPSWEACVNTCCLEKIAGDKTCNYVVFNTKMKGRSPNCYQFYYPAKEACPVKPALGLVTFRIIEGQEIPRPPPSLSELPHPTANRSLASPQAAGFDLARPPGGLDSLPRAFKKEKIFGPAEHPLGKVDGPSQHPKAGRTNDVEVFGSSLVQRSSSAANTIQQSAPVKLPLATHGSQTSRTVGAAAIRRSASHAPLSAPYARKTKVAALHPRKAALPQPLFPSKTQTHNFSSLSATLPTPNSSASVRDSHLSNGQFSLEGYSPEGSPGRRDGPQLSNQRFILATLFIAVLFLLLTVVIGGKMLDSLKLLHEAGLLDE
ncbi:MANSC domain-containing protein 1 [Python bivittatus]|uniref:MANSC domain-containing protein 1 n=1 Tax=Python bivittatus TaxID=176946 RepID=A0A9F2R449_PYTBI|nr:MANSC domain-containing protein 1 [Python bivittatus]XP_025027300.1 MANSC domain-containing protein 1 [Python bivittatus]XP_025027301.1 MANSC domain-containing protein 1 [Python bivittatus]